MAKHIKEIKTEISILAVVMLFMLMSFNAFAAGCGVGYGADGKLANQCPNGSIARVDISPKCLEEANKSANTCINTMPTTNVSRVPEDVCQRNAGYSKPRNHNGMDYAAPIGAPVTASSDGTIDRIVNNYSEPPRGTCQPSYGNVIYMTHKSCNGKSFQTIYGHLNRAAPNIKAGMTVKKGELIGYVGGTGGACGRPHLHFEIKQGNSVMNPMCDEIQGVCSCQTPMPKTEVSKCRDPNAKVAAASSSGSISAVGPTSGPYATAINSQNLALREENSGICDSFDDVRNRYREWGCLFCKPFQIMFNTASVMAKKSFDTLADSVVVVVVVGFALWLAFTIMKFVSTMEIREPRILIKTLLNQAFRVLLVVILLKSDLLGILALTIDPVFMTGLKLAQSAGKINEACDLADLTIVGADLGGLSQQMGVGILCTIKSIQDQIADLFALGRTMWCIGWVDERILKIFPHFGYVLSGALVYIAAVALLLIYPFLLVDSVLKLAIAMGLFPAALGAFAFKVTSKYLQKIWETFLNAMFSFIFLSIIILIISAIAADTAAQMFADNNTNGFVAQFWWMPELLKLLFTCFLGWAVLGETKDFSGKFASGISLSQDIGGKTGSTANEGIRRLGTKSASFAYKQSKPLRQKALGGMHSIGMRGRKMFIENMHYKAHDENNNVLKDENGNTLYHTANLWQAIRGKKVLSSFSKDASGNLKRTTYKLNKDGTTKQVKQTDKYGSITKHMVGDKVIATDTTARGYALRGLVKKDGSIRENRLNEFMQNSMMNEEEKHIMLMNTIIKERLSGTFEGQTLEDAYKDRVVEIGTDDQGRKTVVVKQNNTDGSKSSFSMTVGGNGRVMTEVENIGANGKGTSLASDGIVQRKSHITEKYSSDGKISERTTKDHYAFTKYYSSISTRPLYSDGDIVAAIPKDSIMFGKDDMSKFANQVGEKGNKYYTFKEFSE